MLRSNLDIMSPQWTDVIFKGRNQAYGAYQLRKDNAYNTNRAVIIAASLFVLALSAPTIVNWVKGFIPEAAPVVKITEVKLFPPPPIQITKPITPPPVQQSRARSAQDVVRFPPPVVRPDLDTREDPPTQDKLVNATTGQENIKGTTGADVPIDVKIGTEDIKGVTEAAPDETVFHAVEVSPEYPGGEAAFGKFLQSHIRYPAVAKENGTQGRVFIQFVVERDGSLTDMKIVRDPGSGLGDEALRVLKITPHWKPGIQNGKPVRVLYTVPVNFALSE